MFVGGNRRLLRVFIGIILQNGVVGRFTTALFQQLLQFLLKKGLKLFVAPVREPHFNTVVHLAVTGVRLVNHTRARNVPRRIKRLAKQTHHQCLPKHRQCVVVFLYTSSPSNKTTQENAHPVTAVLVVRIFIFGLDALFENTLTNDLPITLPPQCHSTTSRRRVRRARIRSLHHLFALVIKNIPWLTIPFHTLRYWRKTFPKLPKRFHRINRT